MELDINVTDDFV